MKYNSRPGGERVNKNSNFIFLEVMNFKDTIVCFFIIWSPQKYKSGEVLNRVHCSHFPLQIIYTGFFKSAYHKHQPPSFRVARSSLKWSSRKFSFTGGIRPWQKGTRMWRKEQQEGYTAPSCPYSCRDIGTPVQDTWATLWERKLALGLSIAAAEILTPFCCECRVPSKWK